jgi:hypothetical protein
MAGVSTTLAEKISASCAMAQWRRYGDLCEHWLAGREYLGDTRNILRQSLVSQRG